VSPSQYPFARNVIDSGDNPGYSLKFILIYKELSCIFLIGAMKLSPTSPTLFMRGIPHILSSPAKKYFNNLIARGDMLILDCVPNILSL